jgi:EmrB/QacA subfamily drug resistance transporter
MALAKSNSPRPLITTGTGHQISHNQLLVIMGGIMLGLLLTALDQTVVGPAMFKIIKDLKGLEHYAWVTTAYLLTSTVTVPIAGKLGDLHGRKWYFVGGMIVFMIGSAVSGLANGTADFSLFGVGVSGLTVGMAQLIAFRAFQGIGGGFMMANAFTIIGDLVPPADRGRWQGLLGAVFGLASVVGPTVGGYITDNLGWQWVFYVNLPVGIVALAVVVFLFPALAPARSGSSQIDWLGALTLVGATVPLLLALSLGGSNGFAWDSAGTLGLLALSAVLTIAFVLVESRAAEPLIAPALFKNRTFTLSIITVLLVGVGMFGAMINIPLFIQGVQGDSATNSGNAITPMMMVMIVVSIVSGQIVSRTGRYRVMAVGGQIAITAGMFLLASMTVATPRWQTIASMMVMGLGLGVAMPLYTLIVQNAFPARMLGVVTSATTFFRSVGGTIGVAVLGTVVNNRFTAEYASQLSPAVKASPALGRFLASASPQSLISPDTITTIQQVLQAAGLPAAQINLLLTAIQAPIRPALGAATTEAFLIGAIVVAFTILTAAFIPEIALGKTHALATTAEESGEELERELVA